MYQNQSVLSNTYEYWGEKNGRFLSTTKLSLDQNSGAVVRQFSGSGRSSDVIMPEPEKKRKITEEIDRMEIIFAVILLIATVTSALCAYEATLWSGTKNSLTDISDNMRTDSIQASNDANRKFSSMSQFSSLGAMQRVQTTRSVQVLLRTGSIRSLNLHLRPGLLKFRGSPLAPYLPAHLFHFPNIT